MKARISGMFRPAAAVVMSAVLLAPAYAQAEGKTIKFIPEADLRSLDPIWTTAYITRNHDYWLGSPAASCSFSSCQIGLMVSANGRKRAVDATGSAMKSW